MAVVKNRRTTGTTVGWTSGLKFLVRYYKFTNVKFTSREFTIVPYDNKLGRGPFSDESSSSRVAAPSRRLTDRRRRHYQRC